MVINQYSGNPENLIFQNSIYYAIFYGTISFVLVLVVLLLLYVTCSKKYQLNWFERNLLERDDKINPSYSQADYISVATECESGSNRSVSNFLNEDNFWIPFNHSKNIACSNENADCSVGEDTGDKEPIARSDSQVVLCSTKSPRPRVSSMNTRLDHTKIDSSFYQEVFKSSSAEDTRGLVNISMSYDQAAGILSVRLIQTKDLSPRDFSRTSNPYAKIRLLPDCKNVWQTRIHKKTVNPVFDEDFVFEVPTTDLNYRTLEIILYDFDAYSRHLTLGEVRIPLSEFVLSGKVTIWRDLHPCSEPFERTELGHLMVTLSFLQSAERLTIVINKARNLRIVDETRLSCDPFVKISLIQDGRRVKKKKTSVQRNTVNPIFNEPLTFDISKENLPKMCIEFYVYHDNKLGSSEFLGKALIGSGSSSQEEFRFFKELLREKTAISRWLTLNTDN